MTGYTITTMLNQPYRDAIEAEPSIATVLPCNVVVRSLDDNTTLVEALDPEAMMGLADTDSLHEVANDAKGRLKEAFGTLGSSS